MFSIKLDQFDHEEDATAEVADFRIVATLAVVFNIQPYEIEVYRSYGGNIVFKYDTFNRDVLELVKKDLGVDPSYAIYRNTDMRNIFRYQATITNTIEKEYAARESEGFFENVVEQ